MKVSVPYNIYSPSQYPWMGINYFLIILAISVIIRRCLLGLLFGSRKIVSEETIAEFRDLSEAKKRNCIIYILSILVTSFAFFAQIYGGKDVLFKFEDDIESGQYEWMNISIEILSIFYVWELVYREHIGWPLLLHHVCTILLIQLVVASFFDTGLVIYLRLALVMGFHATTEQTSFIALYLFRLNLYPVWQPIWFHLAAWQSLIIKTSVNICIFIYWIDIVKNALLDTSDKKWHIFWEIFMLPSVFVLFCSQLYACKILFIIGRGCKASNEKRHKKTVCHSVVDEVLGVEYAVDTQRIVSENTLMTFDTGHDTQSISSVCGINITACKGGNNDENFVINDTNL